MFRATNLAVTVYYNVKKTNIFTIHFEAERNITDKEISKYPTILIKKKHCSKKSVRRFETPGY